MSEQTKFWIVIGILGIVYLAIFVSGIAVIQMLKNDFLDRLKDIERTSRERYIERSSRERYK